MDNKYLEMGCRIKNRRTELKMKQSELAEMLDISNNHMSSIERGHQKPSMDIFLQICEALKVTPDYLLLGSVRASNVPQNIIDKLHLCSPEDIELTEKMVELLVERNQAAWNHKHFL